MTTSETFARLAEIALVLDDAAGLERTCDALERGRLERGSTAAMRAALAAGNGTIEAALRALVEVWNRGVDHLSPSAMATLLRTTMAATSALRRQVPTTEVVWTGPKVDGSFLRATREVVREILRDARNELLVVGYWIAARDDGEGIIEEVIDSLADAVRRGVIVTVIVDERVRADGRDNRGILISAWPPSVSLPRVLTWRLPADDKYLKLHAKVLVGDQRDALVTSANLTAYALDRNMEMGVRIVGQPAKEIARHFEMLGRAGILAPPDEKPGLP